MGSKLTIYCYRHGLTRSNTEGRFGGTLDSLLTRQGWEELYHLKENYDYPAVQKLYTSPAIRCRETASVLFPDMEPCIYEGLWEYKFGCKENTLCSDYFGTELYDSWMEQEMSCAFDYEGGETLLEAQFRILAAFTRIIKDCQMRGLSQVAVISHGEILNLLMRKCLVGDVDPREFLLCPNGMGVMVTVDMEDWFVNQKLNYVKFMPEGAPRLKAEDSPFFARG